MKTFPKLVYICSPYRGDVEKNVENAKKYCRYAIKQGCTPVAPHLYFTRFLDDSKPNEREIGLDYATEILTYCDELWWFGDEFSTGMNDEIEIAKKQEITIRHIPKEYCE
jgi:hypothetical protein